MGFGSTAKKLQKVTEMADKLYDRFEHLREQVNDLADSVEETNDRVADLEGEMTEQRALVEALAEQQGVDVDAVVSKVQAENAAGDETNGVKDGASGEAGASSEADGESEAVTDAGSGSVDGNA